MNTIGTKKENITYNGINNYDNVNTNPKSTAFIKGSNNGTWGFGMSGGLFPIGMNGPFGYLGYPIPINQEAKALFNGPQYNSAYHNGPAYNEESFSRIRGYNNPNEFGFTFQKLQ